ncbi:MAG: hypothetical protein JJU15_03570 [Pararhodobacter sp.]|nr:hypothetical protein [Pararhodobacter sp.]
MTMPGTVTPRNARPALARLIAGLLTLCLLAIMAQPAQPSEVTYRVVNVASNDVLNVRDRVGVPGSRIVGILPPGTRGIVWTGEQGRAGDGARWYRVIHPRILSGGWVNARFLAEEAVTFDAEQEPTDSIFLDHTAHERPYRVTGVAANDVLNIRSGPGTSHAIVGIFPPNARDIWISGRIRTLDSGAVWVEVRSSALPGGVGWVNGRFLDPM